MTESSSKSAADSPKDLATLLQLPVRYWKQSLAGVLAVVAAAGGYALYGVYQKSQVEKTENALGAIVTAKTGADRLTALEALAKSAPAAARDGIWLEMAKTASELGKFDKAAEAWHSVSTSAPAAMKAVAGLGYASSLAKAGQNAKAVEVLENLGVSVPKPFSMTVDRQLATTAEAAGEWQKALSAFERMKADGHVQNAAYLDARITALKAKIAAGAKADG